MIRYRVRFDFEDGSSESHIIEAKDESDAFLRVQPDHPGEREVELIEINELREEQKASG